MPSYFSFSGAKGAILALSLLLVLPLKSSAVTIKQVFSFADSLSDNGNFLNLMGGTFPVPPWFDPGHFSNGIAFAEHLALELGVSTLEQATALPTDFDISSTNGVVFSVGGATTTNLNLTLFSNMPGLEQQLAQFAALLNRDDADPSNDLSVNPDALISLWGGANDYFLNFLSPPGLGFNITPTEVIDNLANAVSLFIESGARQILVNNLPNLGDVPGANDLVTQLSNPDIPTLLNDWTAQHNTLLAGKLQELQQLFPETKIVLFDVNSVFNDIKNDPNAFGFITFDQGCTKTNLLVPFPSPPQLPDPSNLFNPGCSFDPADQDKFFFWDNQHPTTAAHELLAENAVMALQDAHNTVPEPGTLPTFGLLGLGLLLGRKITRKSH